MEVIRMKLEEILKMVDHTLLAQGSTWDEIKASGGIASIEDAEKFIELGAHRLGTSRLVKIAKKHLLLIFGEHVSN